MAEFANRTNRVESANRARWAGYSSRVAYTPFPIEELDDALGLKKNPLPLIVLLGGIFGGSGGYYPPYWTQGGTRPVKNRRRPLPPRPPPHPGPSGGPAAGAAPPPVVWLLGAT